jgi:hypothetical protein
VTSDAMMTRRKQMYTSSDEIEGKSRRNRSFKTKLE